MTTSRKSKKRPPAKRNPIARAVKKLPPQIVADQRRKKLARIKKREADESIKEDGE